MDNNLNYKHLQIKPLMLEVGLPVLSVTAWREQDETKGDPNKWFVEVEYSRELTASEKKKAEAIIKDNS